MIMKLQVILKSINASSFCSTEKRLSLFNLIKAMKMPNIITYTFLLFILISCSQPSQLSDEDFGYSNKNGQVTYFGSPYTGNLNTLGSWENGGLALDGEYKDGLPHGKITYYLRFPFDGRLSGISHGFLNLSPEERSAILELSPAERSAIILKCKHREIIYDNGIMNGEYIEYRGRGKVYSKGNYKKGKKHGDWLEKNQKYSYYEGEKHGPCIVGDKKLKMIGQYVKGKRDGDWFIINETRDTITKYGSYKKGLRNGLFKEYKPNFYEKIDKNKGKLYLKKLRFYENERKRKAFRVDVNWNKFNEISRLSYAKEKEDGLIEYGGFVGDVLTNIITTDTADQNLTKCQHLLRCNGFVYSIYYELEKNEPLESHSKYLNDYDKLKRHFIENENLISGVRNHSIEELWSESIDEDKYEILSFVKEEFGLNEVLILKLHE